jgi:hypothetical protein
LKLSRCSKSTEMFVVIATAFEDQINPSSFGPLLLSSFLILSDGVKKHQRQAGETVGVG